MKINSDSVAIFSSTSYLHFANLLIGVLLVVKQPMLTPLILWNILDGRSIFETPVCENYKISIWL